MLFTEDQWRAIVVVERASDARLDYWPLPHSEKRIYGPTFADGEYFLGVWLPVEYSSHRPLEGPPVPKFRVYEAQSRLLITRPVPDRAEAIGVARARIQLIGEYWPGMLARAKEERAAHRAKVEAQAVIARAKSVKKPRKIGKRARAVFEASDGKCHYCTVALTLDGKWHIEHKFPRALFGGSEQSNLVASCTKCNHRKRDKTDLEFQALIAAQTSEAS